MQQLNFRKMGEGHPLIILHGLFGSSDNWLSIGKKLSQHYQVYLVDQRNHGDSFHHDAFNYEVMAKDLQKFIEEQKIDHPILVGHSMGGKTIMYYAWKNPESFQKMVVVDIAPKHYPVQHQQILNALKAIDLQAISKRSDAEEQLARHITSKGVRQFLLKNLQRTNQNQFEWKINLDVIDKNIEAIGEGLPEKLISELPVMFLRGEHSDYISDSDFDVIRINFPKAHVITIKNAGHWIHAEQPEDFLKTIEAFLSGN